MDSSDKKKKETPEGFVPVYVGEDRTRYEVPVECLNSFRFQAFLDQHEEEILGSRDEPISLLCSPNVFETILTLAKDDTKLLRLLEHNKNLNQSAKIYMKISSG
ncbi:hypothetical protein M9H77_05029 [Catharanthus roseus]|uniref:Uncharacterized protein n=1 Tax=Catharanthus roseus TaxID=4058 RepID=A0ACC0CGB7_CATRO|nr:hypothetical protein M9H77_05029 [Catharanthus roseus]